MNNMSTWRTSVTVLLLRMNWDNLPLPCFPCKTISIYTVCHLRLFIISSSNGDFYHIANVSFSGIQTGSNLCLKCTRTRLVGSLSAPPDLLAVMRRPTSKVWYGILEFNVLLRGRGGEVEEGRWRERRGGEGRGRDEGRNRPSLFGSSLRPWVKVTIWGRNDEKTKVTHGVDRDCLTWETWQR